MRRLLFLLVMLAACLPQATAAQAQARRPSGCREDIPECVAACALRETARPHVAEAFDRRCAAIILGKPVEDVADATPASGDLLDTR